MLALIKRTIGMIFAALFFVMVGHLILDVTSDHAADDVSVSENKLSVVINN